MRYSQQVHYQRQSNRACWGVTTAAIELLRNRDVLHRRKVKHGISDIMLHLYSSSVTADTKTLSGHPEMLNNTSPDNKRDSMTAISPRHRACSQPSNSALFVALLRGERHSHVGPGDLSCFGIAAGAIGRAHRDAFAASFLGSTYP